MPLPIKEEDLELITKKVYALFAKHGLDGISMDEVARVAHISKATLYRYFNSKEDIVKDMVLYLKSHLDSVQFVSCTNIDSIVDSIQEFYTKSILIAALSGSTFLSDLQHKYPDYYQQCTLSMNNLQHRFERFYKQAINKGFFKDFPFPLVYSQFGNMLPLITNMDYLEREQLRLNKALSAYYSMFLYQILDKDYVDIIQQENIYDFVDDLVKILENDFFIDSIRR